ncbi:MAG: clostripain-related cysteine peptidase [Candidatus Cryptobacteroides sp.]
MTVSVAVILSLLCSCHQEDVPAPVPEPDADYTLMLYAMGGGSLDLCIACLNIQDLLSGMTENGENINAVVNYKFSEDMEFWSFSNIRAQDVSEGEKPLSEYENETYRFRIKGGETMEELFSEDNLYGKTDGIYACGDSLASFVNWATANYPAKHYMLVLSDHGEGYLPDMDADVPATRTVMKDEQGHRITLKSLRSALEKTGKHLDVLYYDACLMNAIEYQFELKDLADYVLASTYMVPGFGGNYKGLTSIMSKDQDVETMCESYVDSLITFWDRKSKSTRYYDVTLTKTSALSDFGDILKEFTDKLVTAYQDGDSALRAEIDKRTKEAFIVCDRYTGYDLGDYVESMAGLTEVFGNDFLQRYRQAYDSCAIKYRAGKYLASFDYYVNYSILLGTEGRFAKTCWNAGGNSVNYIELFDWNGDKRTYHFDDGQAGADFDFDAFMHSSEADNYESSTWNSTGEDTYERLEFDRQTGWSRWVKMNGAYPPQYSKPAFEADFR